MAQRGIGPVVALWIVASGIGCARGRASDDAARSVKPVKARVVPVVSRQVARRVDSVGSLAPFEEVTVSAEVEGRVDEVYVDVGDPVSRGRALVKIHPVELSLTLDEQQAALRQIQARLAPPEGAGPLASPKDAAEVRKAEADRLDAEQKYVRARELFAEGLIAKGAFDEAEARFNAARAGYDMAVQNVQTLQAQAAQRSASVALADKKLHDSVIRAPFAGQVKQRMVTPGQYVRVQTPVMVVVDNDPMRVKLKVPEKMVGWVSVGQAVEVRVEAYPDQSFTGKISRMNPSVEPDTRSLEVEALLANEKGLLKPGFFARASIASSHVDSALLVPKEALRYLYGVYKVYSVEKNTLHEVEVKLGRRDGDEAEIVDGLKEGDRIALPVEGVDLRDGAPVAAP
ncbi:MAG TPA: efflux RND transporter periplasmic adaptor subunit [Vicinamibacteria bacterium]|nr:efflux RND transporter periplasmic adaptor subunit [Vicinamibacteria bacterium]